MTYIRKKNLNDRLYAAYTLIYGLQLVGECSFLRCPYILQQQYRLMFLRTKSSGSEPQTTIQYYKVKVMIKIKNYTPSFLKYKGKNDILTKKSYLKFSYIWDQKQCVSPSHIWDQRRSNSLDSKHIYHGSLPRQGTNI